MAETTSTAAEAGTRQLCEPAISDINEAALGAGGTITSAGDPQLREMYEAYSTQNLERLLT